jgi:hypothetical protein
MFKFTIQNKFGTSLKGLARVMQQKYRRTLDSMNGKTLKRKQMTDSGEVVPGQLKRKKKKLIGVLKERFYPSRSTDQTALLEKLGDLEEDDIAAHEQVYGEHRDAVQLLFNLSPNMLTCVPHFFDHPSHCQSHFEHLAGMSLVENVQADFGHQFELISSVLNVWCRTEASKLRMEAADLRCIELQGSKIPQYVHLLRELTLFWHQNLGGFIRFPQEQEQHSPHILCREVRGGMTFDLHMEQTKVLTGKGYSILLRYLFFHGKLPH